jgi:hypothetical protein
LSRLVYLTSTGDELANVEMTFHDDWLLGHLLPHVLLSIDSFFKSNGINYSTSFDI